MTNPNRRADPPYTRLKKCLDNVSHRSAVDVMFDGISDSLAKGDKVQLIGFGTFEVRSRQAREGRNPATGETMKIKASKAPVFKAGKALKDKVK